MKRLVLRSFQSPGDIVMLTAAVRDLHAAYPGHFQTDVRTSADALWENNPHITRLDERDAGVQLLDMHYPLIHLSNQRPYHFIHGYAQFLEQQLELRVPETKFAGDIHLSAEEKQLPPPYQLLGIPDRYWIIVAGGKHDFTAKWWNPASYQAVVDHFQGKIHFVQCGEAHHWHPPLSGVVNLVGRTSLRDFVRLVYHAEGVVCPVTLAMHLAAAVETKPSGPYVRPCVVIAGGREPAHWEAYPNHQFLSTSGALPCCSSGGCWKSRCQQVGDGDPKDSRDLCDRPVQITPDLRIPKCMDMITPADVIRRIELYFDGGSFSFSGNGFARTPTMNSLTTIAAPTTTEPGNGHPAPQEVVPKENILIKFRHGLGDAIQLTSVLNHLANVRPSWRIDVAALVGKHSAYYGICHQVFILDREEVDNSHYARVVNLDWPECPSCYADWPSTKAERCLVEMLHVTPRPELCRYVIRPREEAFYKAHRYFQQFCKVGAGDDGRYPIVLIHYEGNTSADRKNLSVELVRALCEQIIQSGAIPVILDWDRRSPLPDGQRIHNPHTDLDLWGGTGTGDAEVLAALTQLSALMIGVDSGPLHVAGATSTPTIAVWTGHHPLHYFSLADNVVHLVPANHESLLRGDRASGLKFFEKHYHYETYQDLGAALQAAIRQRLQDPQGALVYTRDFWIRANNSQQDLVVVKDIAEDDSYRVSELPMPAPVVVDVGAHIGCFSHRIHQRNPLARIFAIECCPENIPALKKNVGGFATVIQAAMTYEKDVALLNAVYPNCATTGGSIVAPRESVERQMAERRISESPQGQRFGEYWGDLRGLSTLSLEELIETHGLDRIDVLKLDCEGSEFSILRNTVSLNRIGMIIGEYHGAEQFQKLVAERFPDWDLRILKTGELGTFWLTNPKCRNDVATASGILTGITAAPTQARHDVALMPPLLIAALKHDPDPAFELVLLDQNQIISVYEHPGVGMRGFARLAGRLWTIDGHGVVYTVRVEQGAIHLVAESNSFAAWEAHDLTVVGRKLATASPHNNAIALFDPRANSWEVKRPWIAAEPVPREPPSSDADRYHFNSLAHDGDKFILSIWTAEPKQPGLDWRQANLDQGQIIRWGADGFDDTPVAKDVYAPHSLRWHQGHVWWCDSFRGCVCRDDGWRAAGLEGFTRGLRFVDGKCLVGVSKSRVPPHPILERCGICVIDVNSPDECEFVEIGSHYTEVYHFLPVSEELM